MVFLGICSYYVGKTWFDSSNHVKAYHMIDTLIREEISTIENDKQCNHKNHDHGHDEATPGDHKHDDHMDTLNPDDVSDK